MANDLSWTKNGFQFDVVETIASTWSAYFNNVRLRKNFATPEQAKEWLESKTLKELVDEMLEIIRR